MILSSSILFLSIHSLSPSKERRSADLSLTLAPRLRIRRRRISKMVQRRRGNILFLIATVGALGHVAAKSSRSARRRAKDKSDSTTPRHNVWPAMRERVEAVRERVEAATKRAAVSTAGKTAASDLTESKRLRHLSMDLTAGSGRTNFPENKDICEDPTAYEASATYDAMTCDAMLDYFLMGDFSCESEDNKSVLNYIAPSCCSGGASACGLGTICANDAEFDGTVVVPNSGGYTCSEHAGFYDFADAETCSSDATSESCTGRYLATECCGDGTSICEQYDTEYASTCPKYYTEDDTAEAVTTCISKCSNCNTGPSCSGDTDCTSLLSTQNAGYIREHLCGGCFFDAPGTIYSCKLPRISLVPPVPSL